MRDFAKIFHTEELGQILVKVDANNDEGEAEVRFFFDPEIPCANVSSVAMSFGEKEDAMWAAFEGTDLEVATNIVTKSKAEMRKLVPDRMFDEEGES